MGDDAQLRTWVSEKLLSILGYSQPAVVTFIIEIAKKSASPTSVVQKLIENGFSSSSETHVFAEEIYSKVPHQAAGLNSYQKAEKEAARFARKQMKYSLVDADEEEDQVSAVSGVPCKGYKGSGVQAKHIRKKMCKHEEEEKEDEHNKATIQAVRREEDRYSHDDENYERELELDRIHDQQERMELEKRLREKDAAATRKIMEPTLTQKEQKEAIRRSKASQNNDISNIRKVSRQEYLKKRQLKKLDELWDDIEDEEYLFEGVHVTEKERQEMRYKKEIYRLAEKRAEEVDEIMEYKMPEAYDFDGCVNQEKRFSVALQHHRDTGGEKMNPFAEQEAWEKHQIGKATIKFGARDRKKQTQDYEYVFADQIEFIKTSVLDGAKYENELPREIDASFAKTMLQKLQLLA